MALAAYARVAARRPVAVIGVHAGRDVPGERTREHPRRCSKIPRRLRCRASQLATTAGVAGPGAQAAFLGRTGTAKRTGPLRAGRLRSGRRCAATAVPALDGSLGTRRHQDSMHCCSWPRGSAWETRRGEPGVVLSRSQPELDPVNFRQGGAGVRAGRATVLAVPRHAGDRCADGATVHVDGLKIEERNLKVSPGAPRCGGTCRRHRATSRPNRRRGPSGGLPTIRPPSLAATRAVGAAVSSVGC